MLVGDGCQGLFLNDGYATHYRLIVGVHPWGKDVRTGGENIIARDGPGEGLCHR